MNNSEYRAKLHELIPGGAHTYSRGDDQFPSNAPAIFERGEGAYAFDSNGGKFLDYSMGLRSVTVGYAHKEIADAVYKEIMKGNNLSRASITELNAAQLLVDLIPSVEMVKFAKHGSTVTSAAVKLARAYTGRKYIAVPAEQPFFSFDDWFIGSTVVKRGVPEEIGSLTLQFHFNDINSLQKLFDQYPGQIAGVIMEAATTILPNTDPVTGLNFPQQVQSLCKKKGSVFIVDEMITGFRWHIKGAQHYYGLDPDLSTFGKGMANGFAVAALAGKREIMQMGGILDEGKEKLFLTSTTHGAEMCGLGAFIKTIEVSERDGVVDHLWSYGTKLVDGMNAIAAELGINEYFYVEGAPCSPNYNALGTDKHVSLPLRTLFSQEMINENILIPSIALSFAHKEAELEKTLHATRKALVVYKQALENGVDQYLRSPVIKPVFRKHV